MIFTFTGKIAIAKISEELIENFIKKAKDTDKLANNTINIALKTLKQILSEPYKKGDLKIDISKKIKLLQNDKCNSVELEVKLVERWHKMQTFTGIVKGNTVFLDDSILPYEAVP